MAAKVKEHIHALFRGDKVNTTEERAALHVALRDPVDAPLWLNGRDIKPKIREVLDRMEKWSEQVRQGQLKGATGKKITDVISLGIGGSELGPRMVCEALQEYQTTGLAVHFVANIDGKTIGKIIRQLNPETTLVIINSKTFTTPETLKNASTIREWLNHTLGETHVLQHLIAVTANVKKAQAFGILPENIFEFWDYVGGRYSVWSAVGLPIILLLGMQCFKDFLQGAYLMDQHFYHAPFLKNMPVLMALLGIWNINFAHCHTHAVLVYEDGLAKFPDYLQQLEMESNGKKASKNEGWVSHHTAPIIWGGVGCNGQHAYMQLLHQGTEIIPVDFLLPATGAVGFMEHHQLLVASCLSQSKALMEGNIAETSLLPQLTNAKQCLGDKPSSTLMFTKLTPKILGSLIALYEHKVFVQGIIWGINSFDQWGVELGKTLVKEILPHIEQHTSLSNKLDSSTEGLIAYYQKVSKNQETL